MWLLILASISAPVILVSCAKKKKRKKEKRKKKESTTVPEKSSQTVVPASVEKPAECTKEYPNIHEKLRTSRHTYQIVELIGSGGFAKVFRAERQSDNLKVAIKCEAMSAEGKCLEQDIHILREVHRLKNCRFPAMYDQGNVEGRFSFLVMELLGDNLGDIKDLDADTIVPKGFYCDGTTLKAAQQCLMAIEQVHRAGFVHRDIKTRNFVAGPKNKPNTIYLLDFGLARRYVDNKTNRIVKPRQKVHFCGTQIFASVDAMDKMEQSRKDDLECWLYMILDFVCGHFPWENSRDEGKVRQIKWDFRHWNTELSKKYFIDFKYAFESLPMEQYKKMFDYIVKLDYYSSPDYQFINNILLEMMKIMKVKWEAPLLWNTKDWHVNEGDIPYTEPVEVPGNGQPPGFQETPLKDQVKLERYIPEIKEKDKIM